MGKQTSADVKKVLADYIKWSQVDRNSETTDPEIPL